ncbi:MAG: BACON domain-containing carbohydrate-binding protein, partial [Bryobacteraceae bacterium]
GYGSSGGYAAALDAYGTAYVTGYADGSQATNGALNNCCAFVTKLSNTGSEVYTALIGGDVGRAIAVDTQGAAYVAGYSTAGSFANNPKGAQMVNAGGGDAFVAKLSPDATSLVWATFLGGSGSDSANAIALGTGGVVYVGGQTSSPDLPVTAGVIQGAHRGGQDGFVASLSADGSSFGFVTYLGGGNDDTVAALALSANGLIAAGNTSSHDFPIANAVQPAFPASPYAFLKSTNSGTSFTGADNGLPYYSGFILPDPSSAGTILLDTGQGIFRSTDDGASWTNVEPDSNGSTVRSLSNPSVIYTASGCSLYNSSDGGRTWNATYTNSTPCASVIAISPTDPNTVLLFDGFAEYRSTDGGITVSPGITIPMSLAYGGNSVASPDGSVYVVARYAGLYKTTDAGLTWTQLGGGALPAELRGFAVSASNPSTLYVADGNNVYKSVNAGVSWSTVGHGTALDYLAVDPSNAQKIYGVSYSGALLVSIDGGASWASSGAPLDCYFVLSLAISPSNPGELYVSNYVPQSGFVSKLSDDGKTLIWSTFYGPYDNSQVGGVAAAPSGDVWVAGVAASGSLPLTADARNGNTYALGPAFLARIADNTASCSNTSINPATQYSYSDGRLAFTVTAPSGCGWTATPSTNWVHAIRTSGTGSGTIPLAVDANTTINTRVGTVIANGQIYTIVQPSSSCTYQLSNPSLTSAGGTATIAVTAPAGCPWDVELGNSDPATLTSASTGIGSGTVSVLVPQSAGVESVSYGVRIGGSYTGISDASACVYSFPNGTNIAIPMDALRYSIQVNTNLDGCAWNSYSDQPSWLTLDSASLGGTGALNYNVALNNTGVDRTAHISIGGQELTVKQDFNAPKTVPGDIDGNGVPDLIW